MRQVAHLAESIVSCDAEVDVPLSRVGQAALEQRVDQPDHLGDVLGRAGVSVRWQPVEGRHLGQEGRHPSVSELQVVLARLARLAQHVVVDIGQVLDIGDVMAQVLQVPMEHVEAEVGERVPQVAGVVGGDAADVEPDRPVPDGRERVAPTSSGVVESEGHRRIIPTQGGLRP